MAWKSPNTITGDAATGPKYFPRPQIQEEFWHEIGKGNHILLSAPRRVGKTSIMMELVESCSDEYVCLYQNIEGVKTREEFYHRLYNIIIECHQRSKLSQVQSATKDWIGRFSISEVTTDGVKISRTAIDYEQKLMELIPELANAKVHTVIFLDEFAEVINKLKKKGQAEEAISILHRLREIRSTKGFKHFSIVFAGSIGLESVVRKMDRPKLINDLHPIRTEALTEAEAEKFIKKLVHQATIQLSNPVIQKITQVTGHLLPYFIQLMIEEIDYIARRSDDPEISEEIVQKASENIISKNKNFEDWISRLKDYQAENFAFINHILMHIAHTGRISIQEIYNISILEKYRRQDDYMDFIDELIADGYLMLSGQDYIFLSPFLQRFWLRKFPIYEQR